MAKKAKRLSKEVYEAAFVRAGDWGQQARDFCPTSGYPIDYLLEQLFALVGNDDLHRPATLADMRLERVGEIVDIDHRLLHA